MEKQPPSGFSISALAIRQHIGTLMVTLAVIVVGVYFLLNLQVDLLPSITYPRIGVRLEAPGISPDVAIDEITRPLEEALSATEGVVQVYSQTREGQVSVDLYFEPGGNIDQALNDATAAFNRARNNLPDTIEEPRLFKVDPSQLPVYELALASNTLDSLQLRVFADEELARELNVVAGVAAVDVSGGLEEEVQVRLDLNRLQALGVGINDVLDELRESNQDLSGGRILGRLSEPLTRTIGRFKNPREIRDLTFRVGDTEDGSRRVYLRDFAEVIDGSAEQRLFVSLNGQPAVKVSIQKQPDANTIAVVEAVKQRLQELRDTGLIPADTQLLPTLDESVFINNAISNVTGSGLIGTALAALAVLLFLGSFRQTLIIVLAIPLATLTAIILMKLSGLSLNVFSLGGLALGVGIVVDNSIVMLETIAEDAGMTPGKDGRAKLKPAQLRESAAASGRAVESALVASTATNLVAVLPFLLIGGFIALLFNELILTISFAVAASILVAVTVVPVLASRLLAIPWSSNISHFPLLVAFNGSFVAATKSYGTFLERVLRWRIGVVLMCFLVLGAGSIAVVRQIPQEILPRINTGQANLIALFPAGTPLATNKKVMDAVDKILLALPDTEYVFTTSGGFLFGANTTENPLRGSSTIALKPGTDVEKYVSAANGELARLNLADIRLRLSPGQVRGLILNNSPVRADVDVMLQGEDTRNLERAGREVLNALDGAQQANYRPDADARQPELQIDIDRERAADLALNTQDVGFVIQMAIEGTIPTQLQRGNRLVDVRVQLERESIERPSQLADLPLFTEDNHLVRLGNVTRIRTGEAPGQIQRINQRQVFLIAGTLNEGASLGSALEEVDRLVNQVELPSGITRLPSVSAESVRQIQDALPLLGGLAAFLVFVVMAVQYNSLVDPLVIMFTLPLALAGGILGLYVTRTAIGATVIVGAVLLVGIVVNNAIIMVELANQIRERDGCSRRVAILRASPGRLRPVLMTTITTVVGMFPLALGTGQGGEFLQPLGIVVFSGLALATVLTLFIIPCLYVLLHDIFSGRRQKNPVLPGSTSL
ncbi:MAG: Multidrug resistance protein MdtC [Chroococcopsis gigantea SAG 12.99]|jgi:multidrug efflux pump subunit AcrB|nr:efflux RND transporter permease subunit [Chlorogloea purpurea SAG 13.99]MDV3001263.1 Multidrug resistance protein MdtC [Chroococcopsis gigantea SAG 12.99]